MAVTKVTWRGIVKVQRNLSGYDGENGVPIPPGTTALITSKDGSIYYTDAVTPDVARWFPTRQGISFERQHKFYAEAELVGTIINLVRKAQWQDW